MSSLASSCVTLGSWPTSLSLILDRKIWLQTGWGWCLLAPEDNLKDGKWDRAEAQQGLSQGKLPVPWGRGHHTKSS